MDILLLLFPLAGGFVIIGSLELIRRFTMSQPVGNRTVRLLDYLVHQKQRLLDYLVHQQQRLLDYLVH